MCGASSWIRAADDGSTLAPSATNWKDPRTHPLADLGDIPNALDQLGLPAIGVDRGGTIVWLNPSAKAVVGDLVGSQYTAMFATEARPTVEDAFARKVVGKVRATDYPAVVLTRNGEHVPVEVSSVRVERAGHVAGIFGVFEPETDRTLTETCAQLTPRQSQVLRLLAQGASTDQIAASLGVTRETVRNHVRDILRRLNAHSRLEAVLTARKLELV